MALNTLYNYNPNAPTQITREEYINVGSGDNILGDIRRAYKATDADFEIWDSAVGGTQLTRGVDYEFRDQDTLLTSDSGFDVYSAYRIINATYQTGSIYITYKIVMSYNDADLQNSILSDLDDLMNGLIGNIFSFGNNSVPSGFLLCDGSPVSRTTYADLFAVIGTTWGIGDGSTTFNLPDLEGMFLRGTGTHGTLTMEDTNPFSGPVVGSSENDQFMSHYHTHNLTAVSFWTTTVFSTNSFSGGQNWTPVGLTVQGPITDGTQGTRNGDETRPVAYGVKYIIKY